MKKMFTSIASMSIFGLFIIGASGCSPSAKSGISDAKKVAEEVAGLARNEMCFSTQEQVAKVKAAGPFRLLRHEGECKIKPKKPGAEDSLPYALQLEITRAHTYGDACDGMEAQFATSLSDWMADQNLTIALDCGEDSKPTTDLNAAAKLNVLNAVPRLAALAIPNNPANPSLWDCFNAFRSFGVESEDEKQSLRCEILKAESGTAGMTSTRLLARLSMHIEEIDEAGVKLKPFQVALSRATTTGLKDEIISAQEGLETETLGLVKGLQDKLCGTAIRMPVREHDAAIKAVKACTAAAPSLIDDQGMRLGASKPAEARPSRE